MGEGSPDGWGTQLERPIDLKRTGCREGTLFLLFLFSSDSLSVSLGAP